MAIASRLRGPHPLPFSKIVQRAELRRWRPTNDTCTPAPAPVPDPTPEPTPAPAPPVLVDGGISALVDRRTFEAYAKLDDVPGAAGIRALKFLVEGVDTATPKVWFIDGNRYDYHYDFATLALGVEMPLAQFNASTYFTDDRRFIAGTVLAHDRFEPADGAPAGVYVVEFWPTDPVKAPQVGLAYDLVRAAMPFTSALAYHPAGDTQEQLARAEEAALAEAGVPVLLTSVLFANVSYAPLNVAVGLGYLRIIEIGAPLEALSARDVVLFKGSFPADLTHVAGIITEVPQTPLSHINLKAKQNHTPNAYIRELSQRPEVQALADQPVRYQVLAEDFILIAASAEEVEAHFEDLRPDEEQAPAADLTVTEVRAFAHIGVGDGDAFGGKTANLAELQRLLGVARTPAPGFGVPFAVYDAFMRANDFPARAAALREQTGFSSDAAVRAAALEAFREEVEHGEVPAAVKAALEALQAEFPEGSGIRLRSSTNNEDLEGFNGAGLYDSVTCRLDEGEKLHKEIRKVWASMWNARAYDEREFWRVPHALAQMGVTAHPNVDGELVNGVAITKNIYDPSWPGFYINAQIGEELVTNPEDAAFPEEMLVSAIGENFEYEVQRIRMSSKKPDGSLLGDAQLEALVGALERVQEHFKRVLGKTNDPAFAMDVEWKVLASGEVQIKQARPVVG